MGDLTSHQQKLIQARARLDRARLMMDLVRKREKIKKMLFRTASQSFDELFSRKKLSQADKDTVAARGKKSKLSNSTPIVVKPIRFYNSGDSDEDMKEDELDIHHKLKNNKSPLVDTPNKKRSRSPSAGNFEFKDESEDEDMQHRASPASVKKIKLISNLTDSKGVSKNSPITTTPTRLPHKNGILSSRISEPVLAQLPLPKNKGRDIPTPVSVSKSDKYANDSKPRMKSIPAVDSLQLAGGSTKAHSKSAIEFQKLKKKR